MTGMLDNEFEDDAGMVVPFAAITESWMRQSDELDVSVLADVLTEAHLRRDGACSETHYPEAEFVARRYAARTASWLNRAEAWCTTCGGFQFRDRPHSKVGCPE